MEHGSCVFSLKTEQYSVHFAGARGKYVCSVYLRNNEKKLLLQAVCPEFCKEDEKREAAKEIITLSTISTTQNIETETTVGIKEEDI